MSSGIDLENVIVWANSETNVDYPGSTLEDAGYLGEEQPFNEHHNWIWNVRDKRLNKLTDRANRTHIAPPGSNIENFCSGLYDLNTEDWIHGYSGINTYAFTPPGLPIYMCRAWNYTLKRPVLYVVAQNDNTKIMEIRNADDFSIEKVDHSVSITGTIDAICSDGPYLYILGVNLGSARVTKIATNPWSATPVLEGGSPILIDTNGYGRNKIIVASSTHIAFIGKDESTDQNKAVNVWAKADFANLQGSGNAPSSATDYPGTALCSDGSTLFFTTTSTTSGNTMLCAANIANPGIATGLGGAFTAKIIGGFGTKAGHTIYDGRHISVIRDDGAIGSFNKDVDRWRSLDFQFNNAKSPDALFPKFVFTGFTAWALFQHDGDDDANNGFITPFRSQEICLDHPAPTQLINKKQFLYSYTNTIPRMGMTRLEYSDGCLWYLTDVGTDNILHRIPNILNRR